MSSGIQVQQVVAPVLLGEGPLWEEHNQSLIFVDIFECNIHRYFPKTERHQVLHIENCGTGKSVSFAIPIEDDPNLLVVGLGRSIAVVEWSPNDPDQHSVTPKGILHTVDDHVPQTRLNDAKCDPQGRLWAGTMGPEASPGQPEMYKGSLYSVDSKLKLTSWVDRISISNGLAWSLDKKTFYYIDSCAYSVDAFEYNDDTGAISKRRKAFNYKSSGLDKDIPDGMCIDAEGNLWVANFFGKKIICINPETRKIVRQVEMPAQNMTSVCWGGENYDILFATSAQAGLTREEIATEPAGATFAITGLGVKGLPSQNLKVDMQLLKAKFTN
ncbi:hypothetical protein SK128_002377 [Halocaridina rubra]|uniref:Regucalcin n=1 Tax=Halocaridina rubra TaxID=373956 RepID=A0AAN8WIR4_HALRR